MRILQVIPYFYPAIAFGGPVQMAYLISKKLVQKGHEVVVYTTDAKDMTSRLDKNFETLEGIKIRYFKNISMIPVNKSRLFLTPNLISEIKKEIQSFDIVHLHEYRTFQNLVISYYAKKYDIPYILQAHGSLPSIVEKQRLKRFFDLFFGYRLLHYASRVVALSQLEASHYQRLLVPPEKIVVVPNAINAEHYSNLESEKHVFKKKFGIKFTEKIILYLGRIHKSKGIDLLIQSYSSVVAGSSEKTRLVIAGPDDGYLDEIKALVSSLDISDSVLFTGFISENDKIQALNDAEIFITPSFYGFPVTFLEACATGTPIITTTLGDTLDWINNNVGYVTSPEPEALSAAINMLLSNLELRNTFSNNCLNFSRTDFSLDKIVDELEQCYERCC